MSSLAHRAEQVHIWSSQHFLSPFIASAGLFMTRVTTLHGVAFNALFRCLLVLAPAVPIGAQSAPPDSLPPANLRTCARVICEVTLETGTLKGTVLQVGHRGSQIPLTLLGTQVVRHLSVMPEAAGAAKRARSALTERALVGIITLAGVAAVATSLGKDRLADAESRGGFSARLATLRIVSVGAVAATGTFVAQWRSRAANRHLRESVRQYNEQLPR